MVVSDTNQPLIVRNLVINHEICMSLDELENLIRSDQNVKSLHIKCDNVSKSASSNSPETLPSEKFINPSMFDSLACLKDSLVQLRISGYALCAVSMEKIANNLPKINSFTLISNSLDRILVYTLFSIFIRFL